ncbi:Hypothetical Protein FCC1311_089632 [Hondaea fermentalgiana]|uniref:Uncharacterized protein n=1 Tax=Hondaea fermentalgiana TaxID=2315210 RepID=A0A2R5GSK5_9STRA|nr:Hypothetical Protein FCC1311_089632 [Hondaea fermentalgiana]|eukprot:GBG32738.1 Hypothetical Protein FCC1311_089632 [Hondaea fermentalgiana]
MQCFPLASSLMRLGKPRRKTEKRDTALSVGSCDTLASHETGFSGGGTRMRGDSWANMDMESLAELRERLLLEKQQQAKRKQSQQSGFAHGQSQVQHTGDR